MVVNTCVCRRSVDNKALILSYPILPFFEKGTETSAVIACETSLFYGSVHTVTLYLMLAVQRERERERERERDLLLRFVREKTHQKV